MSGYNYSEWTKISIKIETSEDNIELTKTLDSEAWMDLFKNGFIPALRAFGYGIPDEVVELMLEARYEFYTNSGKGEEEEEEDGEGE